MKLLLLITLCIMLNSALTSAAKTLPVTSPAVQFSPANWSGDTGRTGSKFRRTWNNGAWCHWRWETDSPAPKARILITNQTQGSAISYFINGRLYDNIPVPANGGIGIDGLDPRGTQDLFVFTRNSEQTDRWSGVNSFVVSGMDVDDSASPATVLAVRPWVMIVGDSITEGILADNGHDSNLSDYSFLVGQGLKSLGYDTCVSACGYSGWIRPGDAGGDVPGYYAVHQGLHDALQSRWDKIDASTSLLDAQGHISAFGGIGQAPAAIIINYLANEALSGASLSDTRASVTDALHALRIAAPKARVIVVVPPGIHDPAIYPNGAQYVSVLIQGIAEYQKLYGQDKHMTVIDLGPNVSRSLASPVYGGQVHPNAAGHAFLASLLLSKIIACLK